MDSSATNGIFQRTLLWLTERRWKGREVSSSFLENGSSLLEGLASATNCKYNTPFRNFKAEEIISATSNFKERVMSDGTGCMFRGSYQHRLIILVKRYRNYGCDNDDQRIRSLVNRDIVTSLMMSRHKNVIRFLGCCLDFKTPVLVYDHTEQDRLLHDILCYRKDTLPWKKRLKIATDVSNAIVYLHTAFSTPVIHRDLSTQNVVIDQFGTAKLIDFSLCVPLPPGETQFVVDCIAGTTGYLEPEYLKTALVSEKTDVYMFGVLLLILLTGERAFIKTDGEYYSLVDLVQDAKDNNQWNKMLDHINVAERGETNEEQLKNVAELAFRCTQSKGEDRPNMIDVARELRSIGIP